MSILLAALTATMVFLRLLRGALKNRYSREGSNPDKSVHPDGQCGCSACHSLAAFRKTVRQDHMYSGLRVWFSGNGANDISGNFHQNAICSNMLIIYLF